MKLLKQNKHVVTRHGLVTSVIIWFKVLLIFSSFKEEKKKDATETIGLEFFPALWQGCTSLTSVCPLPDCWLQLFSHETKQKKPKNHNLFGNTQKKICGFFFWQTMLRNTDTKDHKNEHVVRKAPYSAVKVNRGC